MLQTTRVTNGCENFSLQRGDRVAIQREQNRANQARFQERRRLERNQGAARSNSIATGKYWMITIFSLEVCTFNKVIMEFLIYSSQVH